MLLFWLFENTALYPFRIRLGGTLQDHIVYDVGLSPGQSCLPIVKDETYMFGFREGCLSMERWIALNTLFAKTGYGTFQLFGLHDLHKQHQESMMVWRRTVRQWEICISSRYLLSGCRLFWGDLAEGICQHQNWQAESMLEVSHFTLTVLSFGERGFNYPTLVLLQNSGRIWT